jgi:hypothetical protein
MTARSRLAQSDTCRRSRGALVCRRDGGMNIAWRRNMHINHRFILSSSPGLPVALTLAWGLSACGGSTSNPSLGPSGSNDVRDASPASESPPAPDLQKGGPPECLSACCAAPRPSAGAACSLADASCPDVQWCKSGLVTDERALNCTSGVWVAAGGSCPTDGAVNERGCPAAQPVHHTPCMAAEATRCHYALDCAIGTCSDAGSPPSSSGSSGNTSGTGCAVAHRLKHADATCTAGIWVTAALGTCP